MRIQRTRFYYWGGFLFLGLMLLLLAPAQGHATTFTVNNTADAVDANIGDGICQTAAGVCTLRAAIQEANASAGVPDIINLPAGTYTLTGAAGEDLAATGDLDILGTGGLTISGIGLTPAATIIDGGAIDRVFDIIGVGPVVISNVTIRNGNSQGVLGGGIRHTGTSLTLNNVVISGNTSGAAEGTAIDIAGGSTVAMSNAAVTNNVSAGGGAIIGVGLASKLTVTNGTISDNNDTAISNAGAVTLVNVTLSGNTSANAAAIDNKATGTVTLQNCTINGNLAGVNTGGIRNAAAAANVTSRNSIISNNRTFNCGNAAGNAAALITTLGNNISDNANCFVNAGTDAVTDPKLDLVTGLADNGGIIKTIALLAGSPAIDTGATGAGVCPPTDARGIARPVLGNVAGGLNNCDKGAFEFRPQKIVVVPVAPFDFGSVTVATTAAPHTITLTNAGDGDLTLGTIAAIDPLAAPFSIISASTCTTGFTLKLIPVPLATSCVITTEFAPTAIGPAADTFDVPSNDPITPTVSLSLSGTGAAGPVPNISVTDSIAPNNDLSLPFGNIAINLTSDATITVTNTGTASFTIGTISALAAPFSITSDACSGQTLAASAACALTVRFAPTANSVASATLTIPHNITGTASVSVALTGSGVSATGNHAPSIPVLVSPSNGQTGVPTTMTFVWKKSVDPDGDVVTYHFKNCTDTGFTTGCTNADVTVAASSGLFFAGLGSFGAGIILIGFVAKNGTRRSLMTMLVITLFLLSGTFFAACHSSSSDNNPAAPGEQISNIVRNLTPNTTYYWMVIADDGKGGQTSSTVSSYTTGQ